MPLFDPEVCLLVPVDPVRDIGVGLVMMGEREVALGMADYAMQRLGVAASTAQATVDVLRGRKLEEVA